MKEEKASIIIPCYNGEQYVDRCMESIYIQKYSLLEVIVVDDGSNDQSKEKLIKWCKKFEEKGHEFKYIYQENQGLGSAINTGLKQVSGEFLSLLDIDDEYLQGAIGERAQYLMDHPDVDVVRSNGWQVKGTQKWLFAQSDAEKKEEDIFDAMLEGKTYNWAGSYMVRTKALFEFYPQREIYKSRYGQNLQILLPLLYKKKCGFVDKPFMNYNLQDDSLSQTTDVTLKLDKFLNNYNGYRDIRLYQLNLIVKDSEEYRKYLKVIDGGYWRLIMHLAISNCDKVLLNEAYKKLKGCGRESLDDKIEYYRMKCPIYMIWLKGCRKVKKFYIKIFL